MPVRLNVTIDEDVHERLKRELLAKGISRSSNDAIRARLRTTRERLDAPYAAAARERRRRAEARDRPVSDIEINGKSGRALGDPIRLRLIDKNRRSRLTAAEMSRADEALAITLDLPVPSL